MIRKTIAMALMASVTWITTWAAAPGLAQSSRSAQLAYGYEEAVERLDVALDLLGKLRSHIDRSQFDLEALLDYLEYDEQAVIQFVKREIRFEQYRGLLRGAQGTLMSRAGNSLDQAVLLAKLLKDVGLEARISRGNLTVTDSLLLLQQMSLPVKPSPPIGDIDAMKRVLRQWLELERPLGDDLDSILDLVGKPIQFSKGKTYAGAVSDADFIRSLLPKNGSVLAPRNLTDALIEESKEYFWVEYRDGPSQPWQSSHPAFAEEWPGESEPEPFETFSEAVPEEYLHQFRFEAWLESSAGGERTEVQIMDPWVKPVANLVGVTLTYSNFPDGAKGPDFTVRPADIASQTTSYLPVLNGSPAAGALVFDLDGVTVPADVIASGGGASNLFRKLGSKTESAANSLSGLGTSADSNETDLRTLDRHWIRYSFVSPGGKERTWERDVYRSSVSSGSDLEAFAQLVTHHGFMVQPGTIPAAYLFDRQLGQLLDRRGLFEWAFAEKFGRSESPPSKEVLSSLKDSPELRYFDSFDAFPVSDPSARIYRAEPSLLVTRQGPSPTDPTSRLRLEVDIVSNSHRALRLDSGKVFSAPQVSLLKGTWETQAESGGLAPVQMRLTEGLSTRRVMDMARSADIEVRAIAPSQQEAISGLGLDPTAESAVASDLEAGYWVLIPESPVVDGFSGWWRVDSETGETLGRGGDGRGIDITEYSVVLFLISLGMAVIWGTGSFVNCHQHSACSVSECLETAGAGALLGFAFSYAIGWILAATVPVSFIVPFSGGATGGIVVAEAEVAKLIAGMVFLGDSAIATASLIRLPACFSAWQ